MKLLSWLKTALEFIIVVVTTLILIAAVLGAIYALIMKAFGR